MKVYRDNEAKLKTYRDRVARGRKQLDKYASTAEHNIDLYENMHIEEEPIDDILSNYPVHVPSGTATIDSIFAALTAVQVGIAVNNKAHGTNEQRRIAETGIDEVWRDSKVDRRAEHAIKDSELAGIAWAKVTYDFAEVERERDRTEEEKAADIDRLYTQAEAEGMPPPTPDEALAVVPTKEAYREVIRDRVVVDYVPWDRILWDPTARTVEDIRWHAEILRVPVHEVHDNPDYIAYVRSKGGKAQDVNELKPDTQLRSWLRGARADEEEEDGDLITLIEMHDYEAGTVCTFPEQGGLILNEQPGPFMFMPDLDDRSPYVPLILRSHPKRVWGISDMSLIEPLLQELNHYRSKLSAYIAQFEPKYIGPEDSLGEGGEAALASTTPGRFVGLTGQYTKNDVGPMEPPRLPPEIFEALANIVNDIREATGVSELMRGIFPDRKRTATETTEVVAASSARQSEKRNALERFYTDIARRILWLIMLWYDDERVSRIAELDGDTVWQWTGEDVTMEVDLVVTLEPKQNKDHQTRKEDAEFLLGVLGPFEEVDKRELAAFVLDEMGYDRKKTREMLKLPQELEAEKQEALQDVADQALASEGIGPANEIEAGVDPATGASPPDAPLPPTVQAAMDAGGFGEQSATEFLPTP